MNEQRQTPMEYLETLHSEVSSEYFDGFMSNLLNICIDHWHKGEKECLAGLLDEDDFPNVTVDTSYSVTLLDEAYEIKTGAGHVGNVVTFKNKRVMSADDLTPRQLKIGLEKTEFITHCICENEMFFRSDADQAIIQVGENSYVWYAEANLRDVEMARDYMQKVIEEEQVFIAAVDKYIKLKFS